jgi:hypothetical protein
MSVGSAAGLLSTGALIAALVTGAGVLSLTSYTPIIAGQSLNSLCPAGAEDWSPLGATKCTGTGLSTRT